jgi:serine/threonine-protein kinase
VADFGIALAVSQAGGGRITETGLSLGTPHYMSPEQAAGERMVDRRSDVYALGCVLYEMLAGEPPYGGPTSQAVLARILTAEPQRVSELRRTVPTHVNAAVARALEKLPADRFASAEDFRRALADPAFRHATGRAATAAAGGAGGLIRAPASWAVPAAIVVLLLLSVLGGFALLGPHRERDTALATPVTRFSVDVGENPIFQSQLDLSRDGRMLVWATTGGRPLQLRAMDRLEARPLPGTEDGRWPVFSPDGEWVAFLASDGVRKIAVSGGTPLRVTLGVAARVGLHWGDDGTLLYPQRDGIYRVSAQGGEPERILEGQPFSLRFPRLLPGGEAIVFSEMEGMGREFVGAIRLVDLATGEVTTLLGEGSDARYVDTGHLVYGHPSGALFAVRFDLDSREVTGSPFPVLDEVRVVPGFGATAFTASRVGTVAYLGGRDPGANRTFVVADTTGGREILPLEPSALFAPRFSPDGRKLAYEEEAQIYVYDLVVGTNTRITFEGINVLPVWTPGGDSIVFSGVREGSDGHDLFWAPVGGEREPALLWTEEGDQYPESWGPDGRLLLYTTAIDEDNDDLSVLDLRGDPQTAPYLAADWDEWRGRVSPDGHWAAYESREDGTGEIYVRAFPEPGAKWKVSEGGGMSSRWSPDGRELYYWRGDTLVAAQVRTEPSFQVVSRSDVLVGSYSAEFDVRPDGGAFVFSEAAPARTGRDPDEEEPPPDVVVVVNWFEELMRRAGRTGGTP